MTNSIYLIERTRVLLRTFFLLILLVFPLSLYACSICFSTDGDSKWAYYTSILAMAILPAAGVGGMATWIYKRSKQMREEEYQELLAKADKRYVLKDEDQHQ